MYAFASTKAATFPVNYILFNIASKGDLKINECVFLMKKWVAVVKLDLVYSNTGCRRGVIFDFQESELG